MPGFEPATEAETLSATTQALVDVPVSVISDDGVVDGGPDAGNGAEKSVDVAALLPTDGSLEERVGDEHGHVEHHEQIKQGQVHDEEVGSRP